MSKYLVVWVINGGIAMTGGQIVIETEKQPYQIIERLKKDLGSNKVEVSVIAL